MKNKQKLTGFLAAILNVIASSLFWYSEGRQNIDQVAADTSSALGNWFFLISLVLWMAFIVVSIRNKK